MRYLEGTELRVARKFLEEAQREARKSTCKSRKCGAVIVRNHMVVGRGFNSPPKDLESQRRCGANKGSLDSKVTDATCCIHAERRAVSSAIKKRSTTANGSTMYFTSVDDDGKRIHSGKPYCTDCSKMALDEGVSEWVLEHSWGTILYGAEEYNELSYNYGKS